MSKRPTCLLGRSASVLNAVRFISIGNSLALSTTNLHSLARVHWFMFPRLHFIVCIHLAIESDDEMKSQNTIEKYSGRTAGRPLMMTSSNVATARKAMTVPTLGGTALSRHAASLLLLSYRVQGGDAHRPPKTCSGAHTPLTTCAARRGAAPSRFRRFAAAAVGRGRRHVPYAACTHAPS